MDRANAIRFENVGQVNVCPGHGSITLLNAPKQPDQVAKVFTEWEWLHLLEQS